MPTLVVSKKSYWKPRIKRLDTAAFAADNKHL